MKSAKPDHPRGLKEDFARAIADFDEALKLDPRLGDTYCSLGAAWLALDKLAEAEADFARCRALGGRPNLRPRNRRSEGGDK